MSLSEIVVNKPLRLWILTGVASSSYFFCGNFSGLFHGIVPTIHDKRIEDYSVATRVELWKWFYDRAKFHYIATGLLSSISFTTAAYLSPSRTLSKLMLFAGTTAILPSAWTIVMMLPINHQLEDMHASRSLRGDSKVQQDKAMDLIAKWERLHLVRVFIAGTTWIAGLAAFSGYV